MIAVVLSLGHYCAREQELISNASILKNLLYYTVRKVNCYTGKNPMLLLSTFSVDKNIISVEFPCKRIVAIGERRNREIEIILKNLCPNDFEWVVVIRPCVGKVTGRRLKHFFRQLSQVDSAYALSLIPFDINNHPRWNISSIEARFSYGNSIRVPDIGESRPNFLHDQYREIYEAFGSKREVNGSQFLPDAYHNDNALYGIRGDCLDTFFEKEVASYTSVFYQETSKVKIPWFFRLPIFQIHRDFPLDLDAIGAHMDMLCDGRTED